MCAIGKKAKIVKLPAIKEMDMAETNNNNNNNDKGNKKGASIVLETNLDEASPASENAGGGD